MASSKQKKSTKSTPVNSVNREHHTADLTTLSNVVSTPDGEARKRTGKHKRKPKAKQSY